MMTEVTGRMLEENYLRILLQMTLNIPLSELVTLAYTITNTHTTPKIGPFSIHGTFLQPVCQIKNEF